METELSLALTYANFPHLHSTREKQGMETFEKHTFLQAFLYLFRAPVRMVSPIVKWSFKREKRQSKTDPPRAGTHMPDREPRGKSGWSDIIRIIALYELHGSWPEKGSEDIFPFPHDPPGNPGIVG